MMRELTYILMDPTGNRTLLITDPISEADRPAAAAELMKLEPSAEQAGFLDKSGICDIALHMAGGEFCGNATMSAAVYCCMKSGKKEGQIQVEASGAPDPVSVRVSAADAGFWQGCVSMPLPLSIKTISFPDGQTLPVVSFPGISHVILEQTMSDACAEALVKAWCRHLDADALGLLFWNRAESSLRPLVYVPAADTLFWESACASGSSAIGAWMASKTGTEVQLSLQQPGGILQVSASPKGSLFLHGTVYQVCKKTAAVPLP